jgi:hypothetical protein
MTGWKTKIGAAGLILTGLGTVIAGVVDEPMDGELITTGIALISTGLATFGIGHKIEKGPKS